MCKAAKIETKNYKKKSNGNMKKMAAKMHVVCQSLQALIQMSVAFHTNKSE